MSASEGSSRSSSTSPRAKPLAVVASSARAVLRQARGRLTTDILTWRYRDEFLDVWRTADWIPGWFHEGSASLFYSVIREQHPAVVVEIGSYLGRSTVFLALALQRTNSPGRVIAVDPHTGDRQQLEGLAAEQLPSYELFRQHCRAARVDHLIEARVQTSAQAALGWSAPIDLLFVDGWHSYDAVLNDGQAWLPHLSPRGVVVFDDYNAYEEVRRAVDELADAGLFHLWGSVFGQAVGGADATPPAAVRRALRASGAGITHRVRGGRRRARTA
jgi:predicted O-methyltransferase YrrM